MAWRLAAARITEGVLPGRTPAARAVDEIGFGMAHELKNSLTVVKALVQLGLRNPAELSSHARLAAIEREIGTMEALLLRFLSVASTAASPAAAELSASRRADSDRS